MSVIPRQARPPHHVVEAGAPTPALHGVVLAGGHSQRLGRDKANVTLQGETLLARAARVLGEVVGDVRVAVRADQATDPMRRQFAIITDTYASKGPAAGILAAHRLLPDVAWLVLACDMARVTPGMLAKLIAQRDPRRAATAFRAVADGLPEPLCAIYEPATLVRFRSQVEAGGDPSPRHWLAVAEPVLLDAPGLEALSSINTPQDLQRLGGSLQAG